MKSILLTIRRNGSFFTKFLKVETESKQTGGHLVASVLKAHDIKEVFTLCGGHISPIIVSCEKIGIKIFDTRHEVTCVFAADSVARLRQNIGVAVVTSGPGVTNTITALKNAQLAESPVLLIGGAAPSLMKGRGALQDIDQMTLISSICKFSARITRVYDIVPILRKAIAAAKSNTPGPVFVEFPLDLLQAYQDAKKEAYKLEETTIKKKLINIYHKLYMARQFGNAFNQNEFNPIPVQFPKPKTDQISKIIEIISSAKKPLILLGSQATLPPISPDKLAEIVKKLNIPVYLGGMCRGLLGSNSSLQMRQRRKEALKEADVVLLAGAVCDFRLTYGRSFSPTSKIISINRSKEQMLKNHGMFWESAVAVNADIGLTLLEIQEGLEKKGWNGPPPEWITNLRARDNEKEASIAKKMLEKPSDGHMNPLLSLSTVNNVLPKDAILVADGGDYVGIAAYILRPGGPLQWLDPGAFGTLGVGAGFALGAKAVYPDRTVVIIYGDGSCGYSLIEFDTFLRHKLAVIGIVGNDACWTQIAREQIPLFNSDVACNLEFTRYDEVVKGIGANGKLIENDENKLKTALEQAVERSKQKESTLINILIGKTNFREGSLSV